MKIEEEIFKKSYVNFSKLESYGFYKENNCYRYSKKILDNEFIADIVIDLDGNIKGKVMDLQTGEEYTNIRLNLQDSSFVNKVKEAYEDILIDIKNNCFESNYFISSQANRITKYIISKYGDKPEFLWSKFPYFGIFRNKRNNKWYTIVMNLDKSKITNGTGEVEIINVKTSEDMVPKLVNKDGYYTAYHMSKKNWITIILDDTLMDEEIFKLVDDSYNIINKLK